MLPRRAPRVPAVMLVVALLGLAATACGSDSGKSDETSGMNANETSRKSDASGTETASRTGTATAGTAATDGGTAETFYADPLAGPRFFAAGSPWNTRVDGLPVDPASARMLDLANKRRAVREIPGRQGVETIVRRVGRGVFINTDAWAPLIVSAGGPDAHQTRFVCRQSKCGAGPPKVPDTLPIPANIQPDPRYDGWLSVIDRDHGVGYDFWRARRQTADLISYQYAKAWTLDGPGFSKPIEIDAARSVGARGSGLPLFAGVIGPSEIGAGGIDHALAISVPGLARRNFVQPASVTDGVGSQKSLPAGARIRLRPNVSADRRALGLTRGERTSRSGRARQVAAEAILQALREYGAIVVDRAAVPTLYAPEGTSRRVIGGGELSWLSLSDFEVIQLPKIYKDPPLSKVAQEGPATGQVDTTATGSGSGQGMNP